MAKKATITPVTDTVNNAAAINTQLNAINNKLDNTLSLDGSTPNAMGADLDMNSNDLLNVGTLAVSDLTVAGQDVNTALSASVTASAASAAEAASSATQAAQYDGIWLDDVATLLADTTLTYTVGQPSTVVVGDYVRTRKEGFSYEVVASGGHVTTSGGVNFDAVPMNGDYDAEQFGITDSTSIDQIVEVQNLVDTALITGHGISFKGLGSGTVRMDSTLFRVGGLPRVSANGCTWYFPATGTYSKHRLDDDSADASDGAPMFVDIGGNGLVFDGNLNIFGILGLSDWKYATRAGVLTNSCALGGYLLPPADITIRNGVVTIQGVANPLFVPENESGLTSRQFARLTGKFRSRFNLSPFGYFGGGSNGMDDCSVEIRSDRCGGYGATTRTTLKKTSINANSIFWKGLTDDQEDGTASITSGSRTITMTGATMPTAGEWIAVEDGWSRSTDAASIPLVTRVASVSGSDITVTDVPTAIPNRTASGLTWYRSPPLVECGASGKFNADHFYAEGIMVGIDLNDGTGFYARNLKLGGTEMSGAHQSFITSTGVTSSVEAILEDTALNSNGIESIVAVGMLRRASDNKDTSSNILLSTTREIESLVEVLMVKGVEPIDYFSSGVVSRFGSRILTSNIRLSFADGMLLPEIDPNGLISVIDDGIEIVGGRVVGGRLYLNQNIRFGSAKNVAVSATPATIYSNLDVSSQYMVVGKKSDSSRGSQAYVGTDGSGNVIVLGQMAKNATWSASGTNLQFAINTGSGTGNFTIVRL